MPQVKIAQQIRPIRRRAYELVALRMTAGEALVPPRRLHTVGDSDFKRTGEEFFQLFRQLVDLGPDERILDVGCGIGRLARPLVPYLSASGSYDGFDVSEIAIRWCQRHYRRYANFSFKYVNVANTSYNPDGGVTAENFSFPYADASFDLVFLTSVFTHMMPAAVERYLHEIARVLAPGGRCLATFFLLNDESRALIAAQRSSPHFVDAAAAAPCAIADPANPEHAVAYEETWALAQLAAAGLAPRSPLDYGSWCGREHFTSFQDIVIADRAELPVE